MSRRRDASDEHVRALRRWRNTPRQKRRRSLVGMAAVLGLTYSVAKRAAYAMRAYAKVQP